jgi:hypothetical protein
MRRGLVLALFIMTLLPLSKAHADDCPTSATATANLPHVVDGTGDWQGNLGPQSRSDTAVPSGDVYREGTDITKAWISGTSGHLQAHVAIANLSKLQRGTEIFLEWTHGDVPSNTYDPSGQKDAIRFVSLLLRGYSEEYAWGYRGAPNAAGIRSYRAEGETTGSIVEGADGVVTWDIPAGNTPGGISGAPASDWGAPPAGDQLTRLRAATYLLAGSPETLPQNPQGLRHGLLELADDTSDGSGPGDSDPCDVFVDG